jgi:PTH1 family peptidyl-tRNA hydrolase
MANNKQLMAKKLIVGLGNYPKKYNNTRHNIGFMVIDKLCERLNCPLTYEMFNGSFGKLHINDHECFIAKPLTLMNLSGSFVSQIVNYFKINTNDIVVICDDVNLQIGQIRIRSLGSSGGQKGLNDIITKLQSKNIIRIRLGIGRSTNSHMSLSDYVLGKFSEEETPIIETTCTKVVDAIITYLTSNNLDYVMNKYNN